MEFIIRKAQASDVAGIMSVMEEARRNTLNPEWFVADDEEFVREHLEGNGFVIVAQCTDTDQIAGFFLVKYPEDEENLGHYLEFNEEQLSHVAVMDSAAVGGCYRGNGLQGRMLEAAEKLLDKNRFYYLMCTIHPDNKFSRHNMESHVTGSLNVFNHQSNVDIDNRIVCYDIKELGKQLKKIGMLVVQDQVWNRVTINRAAHKSTRYYIDEMHLLLKEEQTAAYTVEIWKRFRKWGGIPTGITQNVKDLLSSREVENIFENSDFVYMLNQAGGDRQILAKQLGISTHQLSYVTHSGEGEGLLFYGSTILPFVDHFPKNTELYRIMTTKPQELKKEDE